MLPKANRLTKKRDIERVFRKGRRAAAGVVTLSALKNHTPKTRTTFIVGRKSGLKAAGRNLLKRRARAYFISQKEKIPAGYDMVVGFRGKFAKVPPFQEISQSLERCLNTLRSGS